MTQITEHSDDSIMDIDARFEEIANIFNSVQADIDILKAGLNKIIDAIPRSADTGCCTLLDKTLIFDLSTGKSFNWIVCEDIGVTFAKVPTNEEITIHLKLNNKYNHRIKWPTYIKWEHNDVPFTFKGIIEITVTCNCGEMFATYSQFMY